MRGSRKDEAAALGLLVTGADRFRETQAGLVGGFFGNDEAVHETVFRSCIARGEGELDEASETSGLESGGIIGPEGELDACAVGEFSQKVRCGLGRLGADHGLAVGTVNGSQTGKKGGEEFLQVENRGKGGTGAASEGLRTGRETGRKAVESVEIRTFDAIEVLSGGE